VTFEEKGGKTLLVMTELYPSQSVLDGGSMNCHGASGIYSVLTYQQAFVKRRS
jgi:hypothetical protein